MIGSRPALVRQPTASPVTATTSAHRQAVSKSAKDRPTSTAGRTSAAPEPVDDPLVQVGGQTDRGAHGGRGQVQASSPARMKLV